MRVIRLAVLTLATLIVAGPVIAQDTNITIPVAELERMLADDPLKIVSADKSRPKAPGDITSKAEVSFGGREPFRVKLRRSEPGAEGFNNVPRYDLAAYAIQRLLMDLYRIRHWPTISPRLFSISNRLTPSSKTSTPRLVPRPCSSTTTSGRRTCLPKRVKACVRGTQQLRTSRTTSRASLRTLRLRMT